MLQLFAKLASGLRRALRGLSRALLAPFGSSAGYAPSLPEADEFIPEEPADLAWDSYAPNLSTDVVRLRDLARTVVRGQQVDLEETGISEPLRKWFAMLDIKQLQRVAETSGLQIYRHLKQINLLQGLPLLPLPGQHASRQILMTRPAQPTTRNISRLLPRLDSVPALPETLTPTRPMDRTLDTLMRDKEALKRRIEAMRASRNADTKPAKRQTMQDADYPDLSEAFTTPPPNS